MNPKEITLNGQGHWAVCKQDDILENELWTWWIEIEGVTIRGGRRLIPDEKMIDDHSVRGGRAKELIQTLRPLLPMDVESRIEPPASTPGGIVRLEIALTEMSDPKAAVRKLKGFFPRLYELAK
ncbi:MAG: hypothetical protein Q7K33_00955 [Candidatus Berkelbacteria bacterium]|nr:hypothetical protein [Candidatus Berkelbacteria bacterium]